MEPIALLSTIWNWINANASGLQAVASCLGVPGLIGSLLLLLNQAQQQTVATRATIYQNLTRMMLDIDLYFIDHPEYKAYFYNGVEITETNPDYTRVLTIAEMFMDFMDFVFTHKSDMPNYPWNEWAMYFKQVYDTSPVLRKFYADNPGWYDDLEWVLEPEKHAQKRRHRIKSDA
jgi:hypothetical protein